jgi:hypothetical protein
MDTWRYACRWQQQKLNLTLKYYSSNRNVKYLSNDRNCRTTAHAVSCRTLVAKSRVRGRVRPCGICGGQNGSGTEFRIGEFFDSSCQYHFTVAIHTHISLREWSAVLRQILTLLTWTATCKMLDIVKGNSWLICGLVFNSRINLAVLIKCHGLSINCPYL